ncbi:MAG TPA: fibronectin type III domain-containing protein, partial [Bacteroidia bacterium]|nr:fibronectin type III domain-containing protein [Bacteroidia bacterium]
MLFLSSEIGTVGNITNLRWYRNDVGANANAIGTTEIWLMETANTVLTGTTWEGPGTLVATISNIDLGAGGGWVDVPITSFAFSGTSNLLVSVRTQNAPYTTPHATYRYTSTSANYRTRQGNSDSVNPPTMALSYNRPNIQIEITSAGGCSSPSALVASNVNTTTATISWTAPATAPSNGYEWEVRTSGAGGSGATGLAASGSTAAGVTTANVTGLTAATSYNLYVRSNCGASTYSTWAGPTAFATPCESLTEFSESFEAVTFPPSCWSLTGSSSWVR